MIMELYEQHGGQKKTAHATQLITIFGLRLSGKLICNL